MKKIMFNDKYGLTKSVLSGTKTMTRRLANKLFNNFDDAKFDGNNVLLSNEGEKDCLITQLPYSIGETIAIAQRYFDLDAAVQNSKQNGCQMLVGDKYVDVSPSGLSNKMFVKADLMPHHIKITDIKIERFQDISEEDVLMEGITKSSDGVYDVNGQYQTNDYLDAYRWLIYKLGDSKEWDNNQFVVVYSFELVD